MGVCASSHISRQGGKNLPSTAMVIDLNGGLQEFRQPIKAVQILSSYPNCYLCSSETMHVNTIAAQVAPDDELQLGQLYFLMPVSKSHIQLTLQDLCALAIKASTALNNADGLHAKSETTPFLHENRRVKFLQATPQVCCRIPSGYNIIGMDSQAASCNQRVKFYG